MCVSVHGGNDRARTCDLALMKRPLCLLSYVASPVFLSKSYYRVGGVSKRRNHTSNRT